MWGFLLGCYLLAGVVLAAMMLPLEHCVGRHVLVAILLWPWPIAAELVRMITGRYPRWAPWYLGE